MRLKERKNEVPNVPQFEIMCPMTIPRRASRDAHTAMACWITCSSGDFPFPVILVMLVVARLAMLGALLFFCEWSQIKRVGAGLRAVVGWLSGSNCSTSREGARNLTWIDSAKIVSEL